jgi:hypothetical protein
MRAAGGPAGPYPEMFGSAPGPREVAKFLDMFRRHSPIVQRLKAATFE